MTGLVAGQKVSCNTFSPSSRLPNSQIFESAINPLGLNKKQWAIYFGVVVCVVAVLLRSWPSSFLIAAKLHFFSERDGSRRSADGSFDFIEYAPLDGSGEANHSFLATSRPRMFEHLSSERLYLLLSVSTSRCEGKKCLGFSATK